jgi:hypothetical protein
LDIPSFYVPFHCRKKHLPGIQAAFVVTGLGFPTVEAVFILTQENVNATKRKISEGMDLIKQRQKLIKLADSSDADWRVVDEYIANPLADDSDDEKKILGFPTVEAVFL